MEARWYRYYCMSRHRIRLLEKGFYIILYRGYYGPSLLPGYDRRRIPTGIDRLVEPARPCDFVLPGVGSQDSPFSSQFCMVLVFSGCHVMVYDPAMDLVHLQDRVHMYDCWRPYRDSATRS